MTQGSFASARQHLRARVMLDLLNGFTYAEITRNLGTSTSTIARWRARFTHGGVAELKARHPGKKLSQARIRFKKWLRRTSVGKRLSVRLLALRFGLGKSTVQRVLKNRQ